MTLKKFKIGDLVKVNAPDVKYAGIITDVLFSEASRKYFYEVEADGNPTLAETFFDQDLELVKAAPDAEEEMEYQLTVSLEDNTVIASIQERICDDKWDSLRHLLLHPGEECKGGPRGS